MINRCVLCGYSLTGLPTVHRCPECGRENDRESTAIHEPRFWMRVSVVFGCVATLVTCMLLAKSVWSWSAVITLAVLVIVRFWIQVSRRARLIVVSHRFLELIDEACKVKSYPMEDVADAQWSFVTGRTTVSDRLGGVVVTIPNKFLASNRAYRKVVSAIKAQVALRDSLPTSEAAITAESTAPPK